MTSVRLPTGGRRRSRPAPRLHFRRQALRRFRRRQHRLGAARQRRPHRRPQLQVSPPARNLGRVDRGAERDRRRHAGRRDDPQSARHHRSARERPRRPLGQCGADGGWRSRRPHRQGSRRSCPRASITRLSSGRGGRSTKARFAPWPASAESMLTTVPPADNPQFNARCDLLVVGAGRGRTCRGQRGRARRDAWFSSSTTTRKSAASSSIAAGRSRAETGGIGRASVVRAIEAAGGRVMTRTTAYGVYDGNLVCAWERRAPAARRAVAHPAKGNRRRGRRDRTAARRPRQRPAGRDVGRRGARLSRAATPSWSASASSSRPITTAPIRWPRLWPRPAPRSRFSTRALTGRLHGSK